MDPNFVKWRPNCTDQLGWDSNRIGPQWKAPLSGFIYLNTRCSIIFTLLGAAILGDKSLQISKLSGVPRHEREVCLLSCCQLGSRPVPLEPPVRRMYMPLTALYALKYARKTTRPMRSTPITLACTTNGPVLDILYITLPPSFG